ncbi:MAG: ABC transporter substrate-binding protein [Parasporobacterium sp.]|nr:ABC transporter substrate-binding protein [Parasporobacterium sp.]
MKRLCKILAVILGAVLLVGALNLQQTKAAGKTLYIGAGYEAQSLDPLVAGVSGAGGIISNAIYGSLWTYTADGKVNFEVAESYEWMNDMKTEIVIKIREDAKFSDGSDITANDVMATFLRNLNSGMFFYVMSIDFQNSTIVDDKTLDLKLSMPFATFTEGLSLVKISSAADDDAKLAADPRCSGAYKVEQFGTGLDTVLVKNEYYYDADKLVYDQVNITGNGNENTAFLNFQAGEYDILTLNDDKNIISVRNGNVPGTHIQVGDIQDFAYICLNTTDFPEFADKNVRGAIAHAVDWETIVREICGETVSIATSGLLPSANWAYKDEGIYEYNPELAKEMLAASGYDAEHPFEFSISYKNAGFDGKIAEAMQAYLKEVGIVMNLSPGDAATVQSMNQANQLPLVFAEAMGAQDPGGLTNSRMSNVPINSAHFGAVDEGDTYLQDLVDEATVSTADQETRTAMFHEAQDLIHDYYYCYPLYEKKAYFAAADSIGDFSCAVDANSGFLHLENFKTDKVEVQ